MWKALVITFVRWPRRIGNFWWFVWSCVCIFVFLCLSWPLHEQESCSLQCDLLFSPAVSKHQNSNYFWFSLILYRRIDISLFEWQTFTSSSFRHGPWQCFHLDCPCQQLQALGVCKSRQRMRPHRLPSPTLASARCSQILAMLPSNARDWSGLGGYAPKNLGRMSMAMSGIEITMQKGSGSSVHSFDRMGLERV